MAKTTKTKRELSPVQKKISKAATQIQKEGGLKTVTQTRYKISRADAIQKAYAGLIAAGTIPKPQKTKKKK